MGKIEITDFNVDPNKCKCQFWARTDLTAEDLNEPITHSPGCEWAEKKVYVQITENPPGNVLTVDPAKAISELEGMIYRQDDCDEDQSYTFTTVMMTEGEFNALPKFGGF